MTTTVGHCGRLSADNHHRQGPFASCFLPLHTSCELSLTGLTFSMPQDPDSERSPLIRVTSAGGQGRNSEYSPTVRSPGAMARIVEFMKGDGEPSWMQSFSWIIFGSYFNVFLVFVPLSFVAQQRNCDVLYRFGFSFFAVVPLAKVCIDHLLAGWSY